MRWVVRSATCFFLHCALNGAANAQDAGLPLPDVASADGASARWTAAQQELDLAQESSRAGDLPGAHRHLEAAYAALPDAKLLYNLAQIERAMNQPGDALAHYLQFLREIDRSPRDPARDKRISVAEQRVVELRQLLADQPVKRDSKVESEQHGSIEPTVAANATDQRTITLTARDPASSPNGISRMPGNAADRPVHRPIYRRWQFWTAVAGVLAAVGAVILFTRRPPCPAGDDCREFPES